MSSAATKRRAVVEVFPPIEGTWCLTVLNDPNLAMLASIEITAHVQIGEQASIFGSVKSDVPVTAYALENGKFGSSDGSVSFQLTIANFTYLFTGHFKGTRLTGFVNNPDAMTDPHTEEGSWSAQAQPGPGEEIENKHSRRHTNRSAR